MGLGLAVAEANALLTSLAGGTAHTPPAAYWIQLHTGDPSTGSANIAGNATRKQVTWAAAAGGIIANSAALTWTIAEVDTAEDYSHLSAWTAATVGTFLGSGLMTANAVLVGDEFTIPIGDLKVQLPIAV